MSSFKFKLDNVADLIYTKRQNLFNYSYKVDDELTCSPFKYNIHYYPSNTIANNDIYSKISFESQSTDTSNESIITIPNLTKESIERGNNKDVKVTLVEFIKRRGKVKLTKNYSKLNLTIGLGLGSGYKTNIIERKSDIPTLLNSKATQVSVNESCNSKEFNLLCNEIHVGTIVDHPNLLSILDVVCDEGQYTLITEYCKKDLVQLIQFNRFTTDILLDYMKQCLLGLAYLHQRNIAHRDIKLENIFLGLDNKIKLTGFSSCLTLASQSLNLSNSTLGSVHKVHFGAAPYLAPELFLDNQIYCPYKADIWSLGIVFFCLAKRRFPWGPILSNDKLFQSFYRVGPSKFFKAFKIDTRIEIILEKMLVIDNNLRYSAPELLELFDAEFEV